MLFLITALDNTDDEARQRRTDVLAAHRENLKKMIAERVMVLGGSLLDEQGNRTGSIAVLNLPNRESAEAWVKTHPYATSRVWSDCKVEHFAATQSSVDWLPPETPTL